MRLWARGETNHQPNRPMEFQGVNVQEIPMVGLIFAILFAGFFNFLGLVMISNAIRNRP